MPPFGLLFGPPEAVEALALPPSRSLVPLAWELQGFCMPCSLPICPPGSFGDAAGRSFVWEFGVLVCAKTAPDKPSENTAAISTCFIASSAFRFAMRLNRG